MKRPSERLLISVVLLFLLCAAAVLLVLGFEREEYRRYTGYSGEAKSNPYLAAQSLLEEWGYTVRTIHASQRLEELSSQVKTLFLFDHTGEGNEQQLAAIMQWIKEGGRFICLLSSKENTARQAERENKNSYSLSRRVLSSAGVAVKTSRQKTEKEMPVDLNTSYGFHPQEEASTLWNYPTGEESHAAEFSYGRGAVIGLGDLRFARNSNIKDKKNLMLFWSITVAEGPSGTESSQNEKASTATAGEAPEIWFYKPRMLPSLWQLVLKDGWMVIVTLLLCTAMAVWTYAPRFGPVLLDRDEKEGDFSHYLAAVGRFFAKQGKTELLFKEMRAAALENVERRIPGFSHRSLERQTELLSGLTALSRETVRFFLTTDGSLGAEDFRQYISIAERIRRWKRDSMKRQ